MLKVRLISESGCQAQQTTCYDVGLKISKLADVVHTELKAHDDIDSDRGGLYSRQRNGFNVGR
jgi:hypothetical protein